MEAIIFVGIQGAGKSTFYRERFFDTHVRINLDMLRTRRRENLLLHACFTGGQRFVVDNTNPDRKSREKYLNGAKTSGFRAVAYYFDTDPDDAIPMNAGRTGKQRVPEKAIHATQRKLEIPSREEGFHEVYRVWRDECDVIQVEKLEDDPGS